MVKDYDSAAIYDTGLEATQGSCPSSVIHEMFILLSSSLYFLVKFSFKFYACVISLNLTLLPQKILSMNQ